MRGETLCPPRKEDGAAVTVSLAENIAVVSASGIVGAFLALAAIALRAGREMDDAHAFKANPRLLAISAFAFAGVTVAGVLVSPVAIDWMMAWYGAAGGALLVTGSFAPQAWA